MTDSDPREDGSGGASPFPAAYGSVGGGSAAQEPPARQPGRRPLADTRGDRTGATGRLSAGDRRRLARLSRLEAGEAAGPSPRASHGGDTDRTRVGPATGRRRSDRLEPAPEPGWERVTSVPTAEGTLAAPLAAGQAGQLSAPTVAVPRPQPVRRSLPGPDGTGTQELRGRGAPDWMARRVVESEAPGTEYELGRQRRWRRRKVTVMRSRVNRRLVRRIDTWTVFKMSLVFYLLLVLIVLVAGLVAWSVAQHLGFVTDIQKAVRSLADDKKFILHGTAAFKYCALGGVALGVIGTLVNTVAAMLYNLLADVVGGVQVIVVSEPD